MPEVSNQKLTARAGTVGSLTAVSRVLGLAREMVLANAFGAGAVMDAFLVALTLPNVLRRLAGEGVLGVAFVPVLAQVKTDGGLPAMRAFLGALLGVFVPSLIFFTLLGIGFPEVLVGLFAVGFDPERARLAAEMTRIMMPCVCLISLVALASGALNIEGVFAVPAALPMFLNIAVVAVTLCLLPQFAVPIHGVAWAVTAGAVAQLAVLLPLLRRHGLLVRPRLDLGHPALGTLLRRAAPAVLGVGVYQLNIVVVRTIGSFLPSGELACYGFATRLQELALGVFAVSISVAALPTLSEHAARRDGPALWATSKGALCATNFLTIPSAIGLATLARPIVEVLFRHGAFDPESAALTTQLVQILALAIVPIGVVRVVVPVFYALGNTIVPLIGAFVSLFFTIVLGLVLKNTWAVLGLTLATVCAAVFQSALVVLLLPVLMRSRGLVSSGTASPPASATRPPARAGVFIHALRCLVAVGFPAALAHVGLPHVWPAGDVVSLAKLGWLLLLLLFVGLSYFGLAAAFAVPEVGMLGAMLRRRVRKL
ncbi:MAG: murein biosynthesis integral membrane protein MurJ [Deltaproteobacteria bacterium]|nr:murein biosynthesis integral membrane protein MurJ [Deltaproteobacteria bacterium]